MKKKLITLLLLCSLIIPAGMTGCFEDDYETPVQETTEASEQTTEEATQGDTAVPTEEEQPPIVTEEPTEATTEGPVEPTTEEAVTEAEDTTEEPTEEPVEDTTEIPAEEPTEEETPDLTSGTPWICSTIDGVVTEDSEFDLKDDFYAAVNKERLAANTLKEGEAEIGTFAELDHMAEDVVKTLFDGEEPTDHDIKLAYDLYHMALDWDSRNEIGAAPLKAKTDAVEAIESIDEMTEYLSSNDDFMLWTVSKVEHPDDDERSIIFFQFNTLMRRDAAAYPDPTPNGEYVESVLSEYAHAILVKDGYTAEEAEEKIENSLKFETLLAPAIPTNEHLMDPEYQQIVSRDEMKEIAGALPMLENAEGPGFFPECEEYMILCPEVYDQLNVLYTEENLTLMKDYLIVNIASAYADWLDRECCEMYYDLFVIDRNGETGIKSDFDYAYGLVNKYLIWAVSKYYTQTNLTQEDKDRLSKLVEDIRAEYHTILNEADFISEETRAAAIEKLDAMKTFILFPDEIEGYDGLNIRSAEEGGTFFEAMETIEDYLIRKDRADAGSVTDLSGWLSVLPPKAVNACYLGYTNSIYFPGAIAQGSVYNSDMSDEEIYAKMGTLIGHEITHAFDNNGSMYDKDGHLSNWWTDEDYQAFQERIDKMIAYYDTRIFPWEGQGVNGKNMTGEICADMGAVKCMLNIAAKNPDFDYDKFFRSYAELWYREWPFETVQYRIMTDEHPLAYLRVNVTLQQFDEFLEFYGIQEGDGMYLAPEDRIAIW